MPFTLAHPAIVLPLQRRYPKHLSLSALVLGSMAPDYVYFLPTHLSGDYTHSLAGVILFCLPVTLGVYLLFHLLCRRPLQALLPPRLATLAASVDQGLLPEATLPVVLASILIGTFSHLAWDLFTHPNMWLVQHSTLLQTPLAHYEHYTLHLYRLLQHLSTLAGLAYITWRLRLSAYGRAGPRATTLSRPWRYTLIGLFVLTGLIHSGLWQQRLEFMALQQNMFFLVSRGLAGMLGAMLLYCLLWQAHLPLQRRP